MKLLIAGSRGIDAFDFAEHIPPDTDLIISGGAAGIDTAAERYADEQGIAKVIVRPRYDLYGRAAPIRRNEEMVQMAVVLNGRDSVSRRWGGFAREGFALAFCEALLQICMFCLAKCFGHRSQTVHRTVCSLRSNPSIK